MAKRREFFALEKYRIHEFGFDEEKSAMLGFGIIESANPDFQRYIDILNADESLCFLRKQFGKLQLQGNLVILDYMEHMAIEVPGYNLKDFRESPDENQEKINDLILGLGGYEQIHIIDEKAMVEIPVRKYISNQVLIRYVDFWLKEKET